MAVGKCPSVRQQALFVATSEISASGHPFYCALDKLLREDGFDEFAEKVCAEFYAGNVGRPGIPPGVYFRALMVGYLEGISSERGIAWRCRDSLFVACVSGVRLPSPCARSLSGFRLSRDCRRVPCEPPPALHSRSAPLRHGPGTLSNRSAIGKLRGTENASPRGRKTPIHVDEQAFLRDSRDFRGGAGGRRSGGGGSGRAAEAPSRGALGAGPRDPAGNSVSRARDEGTGDAGRATPKGRGLLHVGPEHRPAPKHRASHGQGRHERPPKRIATPTARKAGALIRAASTDRRAHARGAPVDTLATALRPATCATTAGTSRSPNSTNAARPPGSQGTPEAGRTGRTKMCVSSPTNTRRSFPFTTIVVGCRLPSSVTRLSANIPT